jgi:hypothetical protein
VCQAKITVSCILWPEAKALADVVPKLSDGVTTSRAMACAGGRPRSQAGRWPPQDGQFTWHGFVRVAHDLKEEA